MDEILEWSNVDVLDDKVIREIGFEYARLLDIVESMNEKYPSIVEDITPLSIAKLFVKVQFKHEKDDS